MKIYQKITIILCLAGIVALITAACSSLNLYSPSEDKKLGAQINQEILSNPDEYPILRNQQARSYVQNIVNSLLSAKDIKYKGVFAYDVKLIDNDKILNAFCTPGGYIFVYTGLLKFLDHEATLAGVLGHEIAHAEQRHSTKRMTKAYGAQILMQLALGENPNQTEKIAANLFTGLAFLKNSRDDEYEADEYSVKYLYSIKKWYPGAITKFFDKVSGSGGSNALKTMLSTHPLGPDRIKKVNDLLKSLSVPPPTEANLGFRKYMNFKRLIK